MKSCIEQVDNGPLLDKIKNLPTDGIIFLADEEVWRIYGDLFNNLEEKLGYISIYY